MKVKVQWYDALFILLFFYLLVLQIQAIWPFTIDDMYISLRYARNWAAGDGLLWNIHALPVEGYSNFSFVVLGALALLFHLDAVSILKIAGLLGLLCTCWFVYSISRLWFLGRESLIPCCVLLLYKGQIIWAVSGLETTVYQALLCGAVYFLFRGLGYNPYPSLREKTDYKYFITAAVLLFLSGLTRPEAPVLMILFFLLICWDRPNTGLREHWRGVFFFSCVLAATYLPYFIWRWHYYGFFFPNSVYCKGFNHVTTTLDYSYLQLIWPFALLAIPACIRSGDKRHFFLWLPSLIYLGMLRDADPVVAFDNRLFLPAFALMLPLSFKGLGDIGLYLFKRYDGFFTAFLFITTALLLILFMPWMTLAQYHYFSKIPVQGEQLRFHVATWLNQYAKSNDVVVLGDSGLIPYYSALNFIDSYCLNNVLMSQWDAANRYQQFCHNILLEKPRIIILTSLIERGRVVYAPSDECLKKILANHKFYKLTNTFSLVDGDTTYRYELFSYF